MTNPYFLEIIMTKKTNKKFKKCLDCNKVITRYSIRCQRCAAIERNKDEEYLRKQSLSNRGQKRSNEARQKMSKSLGNTPDIGPIIEIDGKDELNFPKLGLSIFLFGLSGGTEGLNQ